ncbi:hypothetical protein QBC45DRAFT_397598 [Copromyces sp. CBS 386.78]|nr:hypothetical protein QBC45DRAFT_397598 [Copromyces sp. CBS 386.78]
MKSAFPYVLPATSSLTAPTSSRPSSNSPPPGRPQRHRPNDGHHPRRRRPFISYPSTTNQTAYLLSQGFSPSLASNATLALFNSSSRLATDGIFRCIDQATVQAGLTNNRFSRVFYYEFDRTYQTGDPNPEEGFLRARGFESTRRETQRSEWTASSRREGVKLKVLDWPSRLENGWRETQQCKGIGLGVDYYL